MSQFSITITIPEGTQDPQSVAGSLALAIGNTLLGSTSAVRQPAMTEGGSETPASPPETSIDPQQSPYIGPTGVTELRRLIGEIAPNTRIALRAIAEASDAGRTIHAVELRERLGAGSPSALAGILTSLGFAERRTGLPKPYTQRWSHHNGIAGNEYVMEPEIAREILELIGPDGQVRF